MSIAFTVEYTEVDSQGRAVTKIQRIPILSTGGGDAVDDFRIKGSGIVVDGNADAEYARGRVVAVDVSLSVLTDNGVATLRKADFDGDRRKNFLARNSYRYSKTVLLPQP